MYEWLIPDGFLPPDGDDVPSHEALCVVNPTKQDAQVLVDVYFVDREPLRDIRLTVAAERSAHWGIGGPYRLGNAEIPTNTPFSLRVRCDVTIAVQYTRVDARFARLALMSVFVPPHKA
jgi:hypothetical protein